VGGNNLNMKQKHYWAGLSKRPKNIVQATP